MADKPATGLKRVNMEEKSSETPVKDRVPTRGK